MTRIIHTILGVCVGLIFGSGVAALAARNSSGTYSRPAGNPVVSGTTITSSWANTLTADIASELTDSLSRSGKGGMTAPLRCAAGSVSAPAYSWTADTDTGLYWSAANTPALACGGVAVQYWTTATSTLVGTFNTTAALNVGTTLGTGGNATVGGNLQVSGTSTFAGPIGVTSSATRAAITFNQVDPSTVNGGDLWVESGGYLVYRSTGGTTYYISMSTTPPY